MVRFEPLIMSTRQSLRLRQRPQPKMNLRESNSYPSGPPKGYDERVIATLNQHAFSTKNYVRIDAILLDAFFVKKQPKIITGALSVTEHSIQKLVSCLPAARAVAKVSPNYTDDIGRTMNREWRGIDGLSRSWFRGILQLADTWCERYPTVFRKSDRNIICQ